MSCHALPIVTPERRKFAILEGSDAFDAATSVQVFGAVAVQLRLRDRSLQGAHPTAT